VRARAARARGQKLDNFLFEIGPSFAFRDGSRLERAQDI